MVIGASLFAAFPVVYAVFLPAFYIPVLLLLFGLIFRGVAFEFRYRGGARGLWDWGFFVGSTVAAFVQGAAVGAMIRGIPVVNNQYAGGPFEWLAPLPVLTGIGLVLGYALLGAGWLVLKSEGALRDWAWLRVPWLGRRRARGAGPGRRGFVRRAGPGDRDRVPRPPLGAGLSGDRPVGDVRYLRRRAAPPRRLAVRHDGGVLPGVLRDARGDVLALHDSLFHHRRQRRGARRRRSRSCSGAPGVFVLPVIAIYTAAVYWLFRGKLRKGYG